MKEYVIKGWEDYWIIFDELIVSLEASNQKDVVSAIKDAQKYFNGLTDGYYEFLAAFEKSITVYRNNFTDEQKNTAAFLIKALKKQAKPQTHEPTGSNFADGK